MTNANDRRPLNSRNANWARRVAQWLSRKEITPNQISQMSMVMAAIAGAMFWYSGQANDVGRIVALLCAAVFCQLRLLCNLFDGMVAVEGGKASLDGPFWNEFPDRIADLMILIGAGYGVSNPSLGWAAAALAILTAYVRELGHAISGGSDFSGPMAKQHRMATITAAAILSTCEPFWNGRDTILTAALWLITAGSAMTVLRRGWRLVERLKNKAS